MKYRWLNYCRRSLIKNKTMKRFFSGLLCAAFLFACNNDKAGTNTNSGESGPSTTNVQNVNGNRPDTLNGITLDTRSSTDSTKRDSVPR
jgi:hypothetical protein